MTNRVVEPFAVSLTLLISMSFAESSIGKDTLPPKAATLSILQSLTLKVPPFIVLSREELESLHLKQEEVIRMILEKVPTHQYAVRFAAFDEDTAASSQAGRYETKLAVSVPELFAAIETVVNKSVKQVSTNASYVVIVQEYIDSEVSGVFFTRHPTIAAAMRVEYAPGAGSVVGGGRVDFVDVVAESSLSSLPPFVSKLVDLASIVELEFGLPQDIEWCWKGGELYVLQSRPITSIDSRKWHVMQCVDAAIKGKQYFHYTTDVVGESYQEPRPLDYSLLLALHKEGGPISRAYKRLGVRYIPAEHLLQIGNRVFIDKEKEYSTLLPAFSLGSKGKFTLKYWPLGTFFVTAMNKVGLGKNPSNELCNEVVQDLLEKLTSPFPDNQSLSGALQTVLRDFETIYLVNYISQVSQERKIQLTEDVRVLIKRGFPEIDNATPQGNSLSLDDVSKFLYTPLLQPCKEDSIEVDLLREFGRWHSVRLAHNVRKAIAAAKNVPYGQDKESLHFATAEEIFADRVNWEILEERRRVFEAQRSLPTPTSIRSFVPSVTQSSLVISEGEATGRLVTLADSDGVGGKRILYALILSPSLVEHFSRFEGIVVSQGGILSHAAIVAREQNVPVILHSGNISEYLGKTIKISTEGISLAQDDEGVFVL